MSSDAEGVVWGAGAVRDRGRRWDAVRGRLARAIAAAPDIVSYFRFLLASRSAIQLRQLQGELDALILATEGVFLEHASTPPDTSGLSAQVTASLEALRRGALPSGAGVDRLLGATAAVVKKEADRTRAGTRLQPRGEEARRRYGLAAADAAKTWVALSETVAAIREKHIGTPELVQRYALEVPLENLRKTADMGVVLDRESEYAGQLLAGLSAVQMAARPFEFGVRFRYDAVRRAATPPLGPVLSRPLAVQLLLDAQGRATGARLSVRADLLDVKVRDLVLVNGDLKGTVSAVSGTEITFSGAVGPVRSLLVASPLWVQVFVTLPELLDQFLLDDPNATLSPRKVDIFATYADLPAVILRVPEAPGDLVRVGQVVGSLYQALYASMPAEVSQTILRVFPPGAVTVPTPPRPLEAVWQVALATLADTDPVKPGRAALAMLRAEGFDRAADRLILGKLDEVLQMSVEQANYSSHAAFIASGGI